VNRWTELAEAIATALEIKNPDEGIYGKRDWALVAVLEALRDAALKQAVSARGVELGQDAVPCGPAPARFYLSNGVMLDVKRYQDGSAHLTMHATTGDGKPMYIQAMADDINVRYLVRALATTKA